ncbi:MAG: 2-oxo acid dehydrogenase subunit E2 [Clostridiaceae bacterium]
MDKKIIPASKIRKVTAKRLSASWNIAPHVSFTRTLDCENLIAFRNDMNSERVKNGQEKVSFNAIILKACAEALTHFPEVNGCYDGENVIINNSVNIGMAVNTEKGLLVPNIKEVQSKNLFGIVEELGKLIELARIGKLKFADMEEGTFTISSLGSSGIESATPIINQPESAILGVYAMKKRPACINDQIVARMQQKLVLVTDHRLIDGTQAADFLNEIITNLESEEWLKSLA